MWEGEMIESSGRWSVARLFLVAAVCIVCVPFRPSAYGAVFLVNNGNDGVDLQPGDGTCRSADESCTLRAAIMEANAATGADTIILPSGTFTLRLAGQGEDAGAAGDLDITDDLTISGAGATSTFIGGNNLDRVFDIPASADGVLVQMTGITIQDGLLSGDTGSSFAGGAGIRNFETLSLFQVRIRNNRVNSPANTNAGGGAIQNVEGTLAVAESMFAENSSSGNGGGFYSRGVLSLSNSSIVDNNAGQDGGGLFLTRNSAIFNTTISRNVAVGSGGGIALTVGLCRLNNVTVSENTADSNGDDVGNGGGFFADNVSIPQILNTVIAENLDGGGAVAFPDCAAELVSLNDSFIGIGSGCNFQGSSNQVGDLATPLDPGLATRQEPSALITIYPLSPLSALIDAGNNGTCESRDQRESDRPVNGDSVSGAVCDIGAVEFLGANEPELPDDGDGAGTLDDGRCVNEDEDCFYQPLKPSACVGANGFLGQVNIASVINLQLRPLAVEVQYRDLFGSVQGRANTTIATNQKIDFIINDLGLQPDTYGVVCVDTDAKTDGAWVGGITLYKPDARGGAVPFGERFDFALYYPFMNPLTGEYTVPLNTFHLGTNPAATVANWVSIVDANSTDGRPITGRLLYFDASGREITREPVNVLNGGRTDYSGHDALTSGQNVDAIGMARFVPNALRNGGRAEYYITVARYFYDCPGSSCTNFLTAFNIPFRPATGQTLSAGVSTVKGEISIVELNNVGDDTADASVSVFGSSGSFLGREQVVVPALGTRHTIINRAGNSGFLASDEVAIAQTEVASEAVSALSIFYKLDPNGGLVYAYAAPFVDTPGIGQLSQFNSFIRHANELELYNVGNDRLEVNVGAIDYLGNTVFTNENIVLPVNGSTRILLNVPENLYGTVVFSTNGNGLVTRNYVVQQDEYVLTFPGE